MRKPLILIALTLCLFIQPVFAESVPRMDKDELKPLLGAADVVVLDVRTGGDWTDSTFKIKGAIRAPGKDLDAWSKKFAKDTTLVLYCS